MQRDFALEVAQEEHVVGATFGRRVAADGRVSRMVWVERLSKNGRNAYVQADMVSIYFIIMFNQPGDILRVFNVWKRQLALEFR